MHKTHDRNSVQEPTDIFNEITRLLHEAAMMMELVHDSYDGITVKRITTWVGETSVTLEKKDGV